MEAEEAVDEAAKHTTSKDHARYCKFCEQRCGSMKGTAKRRLARAQLKDLALVQCLLSAQVGAYSMWTALLVGGKEGALVGRGSRQLLMDS